MLHRATTGKILNAFYEGYNELGHGFLESVYERAMLVELRRVGMNALRQRPLTVYYDSQGVGCFLADIIVEEAVICELKAAHTLAPAHSAQLRNYLRAGDIEVGLLLNIGEPPQFERLVFSNERKVR